MKDAESSNCLVNSEELSWQLRHSTPQCRRPSQGNCSGSRRSQLCLTRQRRGGLMSTSGPMMVEDSLCRGQQVAVAAPPWSSRRLGVRTNSLSMPSAARSARSFFFFGIPTEADLCVDDVTQTFLDCGTGSI